MITTLLILAAFLIGSAVYSFYNKSERTGLPQSNSIVGKVYIPNDNSFSVSLDDIDGAHSIKDSYYYLAGNNFQNPAPTIMCDILTEPFSISTNFGIHGDIPRKVDMILVRDRLHNKVHTLLYYEWRVAEPILYNNVITLPKKSNYSYDFIFDE